MKLNLEQLAKVNGGDDKNHGKIRMKPISGTHGLYIGPRAGQWFVGIRGRRPKAFESQEDARKFIFFLQLGKQLQAEGIDLPALIDQVMDALGK